MNNFLKEEMDKEFNQQENYNAILSKVNNRKRFKAKYIILPVCIILIAMIGVNQLGILRQENTDNNKWIMKQIEIDSDSIQPNMAVVPHWEELSMNQQYTEMLYNNVRYYSKNTKLANNNIGEKLGTTVLSGYDVYTEKIYKKNGDIYQIKGISQNCAVAIQFEQNKDYYVYINSSYRPATLKQLIEDVNLKENMTFGTIYYSYLDENKKLINVEFYDVKDEDIWKILLSNDTLENIHNDLEEYVSDYFIKEVKISVDIPFLGYKNISLRLTDKGYMTTNILDTGKTFFIGEKKMQEFIDYIVNNYIGYQVTYVNNNQEEKNIVENDTIMMYDNTTHETTNIEIDTLETNMNAIPAYDPSSK